MSRPPLHIIRCYLRRPPCVGGMEKHIAALSREQRKLGIRVTDVYNEGEVEGEGVHILPTVKLRAIPSAAIRDFIFYTVALIRLRYLREEEGRRVVHVHGDWSAFLFAGILRRVIASDLLVASVHDKVGWPRLIAWALKDAPLVFSTGQDAVKYLPRFRYLPSAPAEIFFATPEAAPASDVLLVGSLVKKKNYDLLLDVAARLPKIKFAVIGVGPEHGRLLHRSASCGISNIDWRGAASPSEVRDALAASKLFLNLSLEEGTPTAAVEAMAVGVPVVLTPSNDYSSLLGDDGAGIALDSWDIQTIVVTIKDLLDDVDRRTAMGVRARECAAGERWHFKARQVSDAMEKTLNGQTL